jgi:hypothetical protein
MEPTFRDGALLEVFDIRDTEPQRGDIVVFSFTRKHEKT